MKKQILLEYVIIAKMAETDKTASERVNPAGSAPSVTAQDKLGRVKYKSILIIKPSALGDIVLALPALSSLRASFPKAKTTWLVRSELAPLLDGVSDVDDIILFDRNLLGKWWYSPAAFGALWRFFATLRRGRFDLVLDLQGLFRTALFGWLTGCKRRLGMKNAREFAAIFYTQSVPQCGNSIHVIDYYLRIANAAGASKLVTDFGLAATSEAVSYTKELLAARNLHNGEYVVFAPSSARPIKCWPIQRFAVLAGKITSQFNLPIVAVGTRSEKPLIEKLATMSSVKIVNLAGLTDISQLIALLNGASLVISNDTGPGHISSAMSVPTIIIFGPTNPARIRPYQKADSVVAVNADGRGTAINNFDPKYGIEAITVEQVLEKVATNLKQTPAKAE